MSAIEIRKKVFHLATATTATYVGAHYLTRVNPKIALVAAATISVVRMFTYPQVVRFEEGRVRSCKQLTAGDIFKRRVPAIALALFSAAILSKRVFRVSVKTSLLISTGVVLFTDIPTYISKLICKNKNYLNAKIQAYKEINTIYDSLLQTCSPDRAIEINNAKRVNKERISFYKLIKKSTFSPLHYLLPSC